MRPETLIEKAKELYLDQFGYENGTVDTRAIIALAELIRATQQPRRKLTEINRNPTAKKLATTLLVNGKTYKDVVLELNKIEGFKTSKSAVARFHSILSDPKGNAK